MTPELRQKIIVKLTKFLNRIPSEAEIINGRSDATLMQWIAQDDAVEQKALIEAVAAAANLDVGAIKTQLISDGIISS